MGAYAQIAERLIERGYAAIPIMLIGFVALFVPLFGGIARSLAAEPDASVFRVIGYVCMGLYPIVGTESRRDRPGERWTDWAAPARVAG